LLERLNGWDVDTRGVMRDAERATGVTLVAVDSGGERSFIHHFGANAAFGRDDVDWTLFPEAKHLHLAGAFVLPALDGAPAAELLAEARRRGMSTSLDVCWDREGRWMETLRPCLPYVDIFMPSEEEAQHLTGQTEPAAVSAVLLEAGCRVVVLKLGERGCYYAHRGGSCAVPAFQVPVRETTGAGDCFVAGFLYAGLRSWDLTRSLRFANACGARAVMDVGAVTGLRDAAEVEAWGSGRPLRGVEG
jgi:sugar/nucleoside kinase (ribokinase family)